MATICSMAQVVIAQRGLRCILERRYSGRRVETKEKVHDEVEEKTNGKRRLKDSYLQWKSEGASQPH